MQFAGFIQKTKPRWMYATRIPAIRKAGIDLAKVKEKSDLDVLPMKGLRREQVQGRAFHPSLRLRCSAGLLNPTLGAVVTPRCSALRVLRSSGERSRGRRHRKIYPS